MREKLKAAWLATARYWGLARYPEAPDEPPPSGELTDRIPTFVAGALLASFAGIVAVVVFAAILILVERLEWWHYRKHHPSPLTNERKDPSDG